MQESMGSLPSPDGWRHCIALVGLTLCTTTAAQESESVAQHRRHLAEVPIENIVEWAFHYLPLGAVAVVVEHDDHGIEAEAHGGGKLRAGHLERTVSHKNQWPDFR